MAAFKYSIIASLVIGVLTPLPLLAQVAPATAERWVPGRLLVQPRPGLSDAELAKVLKMHGAKSIGKIAKINVHIVQLPPTASEKAVAALLAHNPHVKFAERDMFVAPTATTNDPYTSSEWHLATINAPMAWDISYGQGVTIAILDSGMDVTHPDLAANAVVGWNIYDNNSTLTDVTGHGTKVAGSAAAIANNGVGVAGIAGAAKIMPVRIADSTGYALFSNMASGLTWAADHGAKVANISYDSLSGSSTVISAANYLKSKGGLTVVSAGNSGTEQTYAPSDSLIVVSATDSSNLITSWSSFGNFVDVTAPGAGIYTTASGGGYASVSGTSFSSPITAGVVALMMSANSSLPPATIQSLLLSTATDLGAAGWDKYYGYGLINASAAVTAAKNTVISDTTAPTVSITTPSTGSTIKGLVAINASASDNIGVARVDLLVNGAVLASDINTPYGFSWDSTAVPDGNVTLSAVAYDAAGNYSTSAVTAKVSNVVDTVLPVPTIKNPTNGSKISGSVSVSASASDNVGVASVRLYVDGVLVASSNSSSLNYNWNTRKASAGSHSIKVEATDLSGNIGSQTVSVAK